MAIEETVFQCENSDNKITIPLDPAWNILGINLSGGLDSCLLTYLTAKTILERKMDIGLRLISFNVEIKPDYLGTARKVRGKLNSMFPDIRWETPYEFTVPLIESRPPYKDRCVRHHMTCMTKIRYLDYAFNGVTKNPPEIVREKFKDDPYREFIRDYPTSIYNTDHAASPLAFCDKQGVVEFYQRFDLVNSLLPLTSSCDADRDDIVDGVYPCRRCWWCREREWGLESNGLDSNL